MPEKSRNIARLFTALSVLLTLFLSSATLPAETLKDAWKTALAVDYRLQASRKTTESSRQTLFAAKAARLPSLSVESGYTILNHAPAAAINDQSSLVKEFPTAEDKSFSYKTTLALPLFTSGRIRNGINTAFSELNTAFQEEVKTELDVKLHVAEAYIAVLRVKQSVVVAESNVANLSAHAGDVANFYEQGLVTKNDLLAARVSLADASQRLTQALNNLNIAHASYNRLLRRPLDLEVKIDDLPAEPASTDIADSTKKALEKRPELLSLSAQAEALRYQAASVRSYTGPQLALSGGYNYQQNKFQVHEDLWSATLGLTWELFDGGVSRHNADALIQKAEAFISLRADAASIITLQVRQACLDIEETHKRIEVTREAVAQSEENLKVAKDRYREGVGTNTEVLDAETLRTRSHSNYYNALYDAIMAGIRLKYATGDL
jgi:outer membrane protein TolC